MLRWLEMMSELDRLRFPIGEWIDTWSDEAVSLDPDVLTARMIEVGTARYGGAQALNATQLDAKASMGSEGWAHLSFEVLDVDQPEGGASLFVPAVLLGSWDVDPVLTFVCASAELFGCRWASWRTPQHWEVLYASNRDERDYQSYVSYWRGVDAARLSRITAADRVLQGAAGAAVAAVSDPLACSGSDLDKRARKIERQLFGVRGVRSRRA